MKKHTKLYITIIIFCLLCCIAIAVLSGYMDFFAMYGRGIITVLVGAMLMDAAAELYFILNGEDDAMDGDLVAGAEDEDGLVFRLDTPVEELLKKNHIHFNVVKEEKKRNEKANNGSP